MVKHMHAVPTRYPVVEWEYRDDKGEWVEAPSEVEARYFARMHDGTFRHRMTTREFTYHRDPGTVVEAEEWTYGFLFWWWQDNRGWHGPLNKQSAAAANEKFGIGRALGTSNTADVSPADKNSDTEEESAT